jgi:futalosine hydrolase
MIALLAAVPEETALIREQLEAPATQAVSGINVRHGRIHDRAVCLAHSGIGKAAAAAAAVSLLQHCRPAALLLFGCGGAYPHAGLDIGDLALADAEIFGDEGVVTQLGFADLAVMGLPMRREGGPFFNSWPTDALLLQQAQAVLHDRPEGRWGRLAKGPFVTVSTCTGTTARALEIEKRTGGICENMEGAAVALACQQFSVPLLEMRGISNRVEDRDTARWDLATGMTAAQNAVLCLLETWPGS